MPRQSVTEAELVELINTELSKHEDCNGCTISAIVESEEDETGCNWSEPIINCSGVPAEVCRDTANIVISKIREDFNIE